jgi:hypothetical protein
MACTPSARAVRRARCAACSALSQPSDKITPSLLSGWCDLRQGNAREHGPDSTVRSLFRQPFIEENDVRRWWARRAWRMGPSPAVHG